MAVMSLDGCLTRHDEEGTAFASAADQQFFRQALRTFDCAVLGGGGYRAARNSILASLTAQHLRIVLTRAPGRYRRDARPGMLEFRAEDPGPVVRDLTERGYARCAILGGARLMSGCLRDRLLDELWITVEPVAFGEGHRLIQGAVDYRFALLGTQLLDRDTLLLRYRPL